MKRHLPYLTIAMLICTTAYLNCNSSNNEQNISQQMLECMGRGMTINTKNDIQQECDKISAEFDKDKASIEQTKLLIENLPITKKDAEPIFSSASMNLIGLNHHLNWGSIMGAGAHDRLLFLKSRAKDLITAQAEYQKADLQITKLINRCEELYQATKKLENYANAAATEKGIHFSVDAIID